MIIQFATCERQRALLFLKRLYPSYTIEDTVNNAGPLLDFVEADVIRITDPDYHGGMIVPGTHWTEDRREEVVRLGRALHIAIGAMPKEAKEQA